MLLTSFTIKLFFIIVEVALAISFGATEYTGRLNTSAILEWVVALVYIFCKPTSCSLNPPPVFKTNSINLQMCGRT